jgi:uncharacterized protein (DUF488 family)
MIFTIGHSNHSIGYFLEILKEYGIQTIVEVRSVPSSKFSPQFNKHNLILELEKSGINYVDMSRSLGGRPQDQSVLNSFNKIEFEKIEKKDWYNDAISRLVEISKDSKTVIMCSEENPAQCHRGYIITHTLLKRGLEVFHIRGDKTHQKATFIARQGALF